MIRRLGVWWCRPQTLGLLAASVILNLCLALHPYPVLPEPDYLTRLQFHNPFAARNQPGTYVVPTQ